ncbi:MAG: anti-sigma F factor [Clostridia bacterium]
MENFFEIYIKATLENVSTVRVAISSFVSNLDITIDELMDIKTSVSEAVTNSIEHGYENILTEESIVQVKAKIINKDENSIVRIEVIDSGIGIEDIEIATTPTYTSKPELEHAGMGFTIMETFMDEIIIDSNKNEGTHVTLIKKIRKKKSNS